MRLPWGANPNAVLADGTPGIVKAAFIGGVRIGDDLIRAMIEQGANINAESPDGITALMVLDRMGVKDLRGYLILKGAKEYDRNSEISKARGTKIDAIKLDDVVSDFRIATSAGPDKKVSFENLSGEDGFFPKWPIIGLVENKGKDLFGNAFVIDLSNKVTYVTVSEDTIKATENVVKRAFWRPYTKD